MVKIDDGDLSNIILFDLVLFFYNITDSDVREQGHFIYKLFLKKFFLDEGKTM